MPVFAVIFALAIVGVAIWVALLFFRNLRDLLLAVSPQNRKMQPNLVYLNFIPVFNIVWLFITVLKIRESAKAECAHRGIADLSNEGFTAGMTMAVVGVATEALGFARFSDNDAVAVAVGSVNGLLGVVSLICWIVYWMRTSSLKSYLQTTQVAPVTPGSSSPTGQDQSQWQVPPQSQTPSATTPEQDGVGGSAAPSDAQTPDADAADAEVSGMPPSSGNCAFCGAPHRPGAQFCPSCGRVVS